MIKINSFTIGNFRSFKEQHNSKDFNNLKSINVLTGENNTGKTNVLRALNLFFNPDSYNEYEDRNYINRITGGGSSHPILRIDLLDTNQDKHLKIKLAFSKKNNGIQYNYDIVDGTSLNNLNEHSSTKDILNFIQNKFKIVYLGATDESITDQADRVLTDMILSYYKRKNRKIKKSIDDFENSYKTLITNLKNNLQILSEGMKSDFQNLPQSFYPELEITKEQKITDFLIDNFQVKINDTYSQPLKVKGSGVQRSSIILMNLFLVNNLYKNKNTIILLDEPEAFLYPTLVKSLKNIFQKVIDSNDQMQSFITTHSPQFIAETSNKKYSFYNLTQHSEMKKFSRSKNEEDIVKSSIISKYNQKVKNEVLIKYGLIDNVDDCEDIIIVEGITDKNYLDYLLPDDHRPQIRYGNEYKKWKFISSGANGILPILKYLDYVSKIERNIFILLDGDNEGQKVKKNIESEKELRKNSKLKIYNLSNDLTIEDYFFTKEDLAEKIIKIQKEKTRNGEKFIDNLDEELLKRNLKTSNQPNIKSLESTLELQNNNYKIGQIKYELSKVPGKNENTDKLSQDIKNFFDDLYK
ncbi:ATP-dependent nuclease [Fructilactobacillus carniphilus]|uniref:AAA family ATPase n=1 Tax=Fructilactobacillus carniphilus TaxID=2940297 RepID=A0ABY5BW04_9LACO|nr:AAA family ATPase [Fructilactobacillus carniphilus]USS90680.1 AAA family ATPase [Fructilactobacillus carniphilus]